MAESGVRMDLRPPTLFTLNFEFYLNKLKQHK